MSASTKLLPLSPNTITNKSFPVLRLVLPRYLRPRSLPPMLEPRRNSEKVPHRRQLLHRLLGLILLHLLRLDPAGQGG